MVRSVPTQDLDMGMVEDTHPDHDFYQMFSEPSDFGFHGTARYRTWVIGCHKERSVCLWDPFELQSKVQKVFNQNVRANVSDYLVASQAELQMEAAMAARQRGRRYQPDSPDLSYLLSDSELDCKRRLDSKYLARFNSPPFQNRQLVYFLGDSADYCSWSAISKKIPTYRLNQKTSKYWLASCGRWMTSKERLCSMGFPCTVELAQAMQVPLLGARDAARAADLLGNSMHFTSCGILQLIALACFGPIDRSM